MVDRVIRLALECERLSFDNALFGLAGALFLPSVAPHLKAVLFSLLLDSDDYAVQDIQRLQALTSPDGHYQRYRLRLLERKMLSLVGIPYAGLFIRDVAHVQALMETVSVTRRSLVSASKLQMLDKLLLAWLLAKQSYLSGNAHDLNCSSLDSDNYWSTLPSLGTCDLDRLSERLLLPLPAASSLDTALFTWPPAEAAAAAAAASDRETKRPAPPRLCTRRRFVFVVEEAL